VSSIYWIGDEGMGWIKSEEHFINYLKNVASKSDEVKTDDILDAETYIEFIYSKKLTDKFTWALRSDPCLLENEKFFNWLQRNNTTGYLDIPSDYEHELTAQFIDELKNLSGVPGVYSFWTKKDTPLYVGVSINLSDRILSSFSERFRKYKRQVYLRHVVTESAADAAVLEVYFINLLKPALNGSSKYADTLTLSMPAIPEFTEGVLCNTIKAKNAR
jgi:hypothetical protein